MKKLLLLLSALCLAILIAGCGGSKDEAPAAKTPVKLGMLRLTSSAPLFIAMDKGYFAEQNIEIQPEWFDAAHPIAVATASSKVDVGATGITASLFNMAAGGQQLAIVPIRDAKKRASPPPRWLLPQMLTLTALPALKALRANASALRRRVLPSIIC